MPRQRWPNNGLAIAAASVVVAGCTSVQWLDADGTPRTLGLARTVQSEDTPVTRIVAPGVSLRLIPGLIGYTIGWRETVLYQTDGDTTPRAVVAFADRMYGIALDQTSISIGSGHRFGVVQPPTDTHAIQIIRYSEAHSDLNWIHRQEVR